MAVRIAYDNIDQVADIVHSRGYAMRDAGISTAVLVSLFSDVGWWGDDYSPSKIGSSIDSIARRGKLTDSTLRDIELAAKDALAWMQADGLVQDVDVGVSRYNDYGVLLTVTTSRAIDETSQIKLLWEAHSDAI